MKNRRFLALLLTLALLAALVPAAALANNFYLIPDGDTRYLTEDELWDWQYDALGYIYNEFFARHGRAFKSGQKYDVYFRKQDWYSVNPNYHFGMLNQIEASNERLVHDVLIEMRRLKTSNQGGRALPRDDEEAGRNSELNFRTYVLRSGQRLNVYTGPGQDYYRAAGGKAMVSTNDTLRIAGVEGGWALIEYEVNSGAQRIGYVQLSKIKDKLNPPKLSLYYAASTLTRDCALTDDPDGARKTLATLRAGAEVTMLAPYFSARQDWAYVEAWTDVGLARGFVPADSLGGEFDVGDIEEQDVPASEENG